MRNLFDENSRIDVSPIVVSFFDQATNSFSYVVQDPTSRSCAVIDAVMNFDYPSASTSFHGADKIISYIKKNDLKVRWILETHVHADHLSAAPYIQLQTGGQLGIGENITVVQETFGKVFNEGTDFCRDGSQFDRLFKDNDSFNIGNMEVNVLHTPGHTPACVTFVVGNVAFVGDTVFMPDCGTARVDFPGGDAKTLYTSIKRILSLPSDTRLFMCHDYGPNGRELRYETTVEKERSSNIHINDKVTKFDFVRMRNERDATLDMPRLILPSLQVNMRAGSFPSPHANGRIFLKLPVNAFTWHEKLV